jgi:predicted ester cyclase
MSIAENKELLARYITEVWDEANLNAIRKFLSPGFKRHLSPLLPAFDLDGQIERLAGLRSAFPDIAVTVEEVIAEGDLITFRSTMRGTHSGDFAGVPPTGIQVTVGLLDVIRIEAGQFAEQWGGPDLHDMLRQLGATYTLSQ